MTTRTGFYAQRHVLQRRHRREALCGALAYTSLLSVGLAITAGWCFLLYCGATFLLDLVLP